MPDETTPRPSALRVAVATSSPRQPKWVAELITRLAGTEGLRTTPFCIPRPRGKVGPAPALLSRARRWGDRLLFGSQADALRTIDIQPLLAAIPDFEAGREPLFDVAIDLSNGSAPSALLEAMAVEVWTYGPSPAESAEAISLQRRLRGASVITMELVSRGRTKPPAVLFRAHSAADRWSDLRTLDGCYRKAPAVIAGRLAALKAGDPTREQVDGDHPKRSNPLPLSNALAARAAGYFCHRYIKERLTRAVHSRQWGLAFGSVRDLHPPGTPHFRPVNPGPGQFWADPFLVEYGGRTFVFFEDCPTPAGKGRIMAAECDERGFSEEPRCVLERPYHLSYPFVFAAGGDLYMIPETRQNRTIEAYVCTSFPGEWQLGSTLFRDIDASDPTVAFIDGQWWLFTNIGKGACAYDDLYLFHAADPLGKWIPHGSNPVKSDVRSGRSAGRIVISDGTAFRLSQDCSRRYGYAINAHAITELTPARYVERRAGRIAPAASSPRLLGIHTANASGGLIVIDGLVAVSRLARTADGNPYDDLRYSGFDFWFGASPHGRRATAAAVRKAGAMLFNCI